MRARVLFFGMLRDIVGMSREETEFPEGADLHAVFASYAARFPRLGGLARSIVVARNQEFADPATKLAEGDEVAFLPPVSGGRNTDPVAISEGGHYFALTRHHIDIRGVIARPLTGGGGRGGVPKRRPRRHPRTRTLLRPDPPRHRYPRRDRAPADRRRGRRGDLRRHGPQSYQGPAHQVPGLRVLRIHGAQGDGPDRPRNRRHAPGGAGRHGASPGAPVDRRDQRGGNRHGAPPARRL